MVTQNWEKVIFCLIIYLFENPTFCLAKKLTKSKDEISRDKISPSIDNILAVEENKYL